jgi:sporulation protein YlmC with PRC-barrel domain
VPIASYSGELDSSRLLGMSVRNRLGEELGVVRGIVIAPSDARAEAIEVEHGGFLGIGEKTVDVPWKQLQLTEDASAVVLDLTAEELSDRPEAD